MQTQIQRGNLSELAEKINSGAISLTNLSLAQNILKKNQKLSKSDFSKEQKLALFNELENKSTREAEKILSQTLPESFAQTKDCIQIKPDDQVEIKMLASRDLLQKIEKLKGLLAHSHPNISMAELLAMSCDIAIAKMDPAKQQKTGAPQKHRGVRQSISVQLKRQVWKNANSQCENCGSTHALEIDHIKPRALGGDNDPQNLRLLCRNCNQRSAIQQLGWSTMQEYVG